jgi:hypothetical protein
MTFGGKDNRGPSIAELQRYVREKVDMVFVLNTGEKIIGKLRWFDENAFSVAQDEQQPFTILRSAVVGYRKQGNEPPKAAVAAHAQTPVSTPPEQAQPSATVIEEPQKEETGA